MEVDIMRQEPARTVADPITAYVPGENTQVSRMTDVHPMIQEKYLGSLGVDFLHQEPPRTVGDPFTAYVPGGHPCIEDDRCTPLVPGTVTKVAWESTFCIRNPLEPWRTHLQSMFLEKSPRYQG